MDFETIKARQDAAVLFADIAAPPMNLLGPALVRDLVSLIQRAEAHDTVQVLVQKRPFFSNNLIASPVAR